MKLAVMKMWRFRVHLRALGALGGALAKELTGHIVAGMQGARVCGKCPPPQPRK